MAEKKYLIGIDLGTTNSTVSYRAISSSEPSKLFPLNQIMSAGLQNSSESLPSFIYFPLEEELKKKEIAIDWDKKRKHCVGHFARERGAEIPHRLISSAKSWLSHQDVDRRSIQLPLDDDSDVGMTPIQATSALLAHIKEAWNHSHPEDAFNDQEILITVPASFDPSAKQLVEEAAESANFPADVVLLEEPQAAFYAWLERHEESWREKLDVGDTILVIDIGGGTTDFSLITLSEKNGDLELERKAVGEHLLLGGDNIDLALAYIARKQFEEEGQSLDDWQLNALTHQCRSAKEAFFGDEPPEEITLTVKGRGSGLIAGSLSTVLKREDAETVVLDGFLPLISPEERSHSEKKAGILTHGLPFTRDGRISCQLSKFLSMTGETDSSTMEHFVLPTKVLFNGGTMKALQLQNRMLELLNSWAKEMEKPEVQLLDGADLDFAVSRGAAFYGAARLGEAIRIRAGTNRSYFIGIEEAVPAVPGFQPPMKAVCIAPFGMEEGTECEIENQTFALSIGEHATFRFFCRHSPTLSDDTTPEVGTTVRQWMNELTELHPVETVLERQSDEGRSVSVKLKAKVTELGMLELWCEAQDERKWKLEFDIRHKEELTARNVKPLRA